MEKLRRPLVLSRSLGADLTHEHVRGELACWPDAEHPSVEALPQPGLRGVGLDGGGLVAVHDGHACLEVDGVRDVPAALLVLNIRELVIPGLTLLSKI